MAPGPSARAPGSGALPRSRNFRVFGLGWGRGGAPEPHFSGTSVKPMEFWEVHENSLFLRISVVSAIFSDFCERVRARGAMPKYLVFLVVFIGIWEPFRPGTHFWAQNPKCRRMLVILVKSSNLVKSAEMEEFHALWGPGARK